MRPANYQGPVLPENRCGKCWFIARRMPPNMSSVGMMIDGRGDDMVCDFGGRPSPEEQRHHIVDLDGYCSAFKARAAEFR